jgi:hypothetical protein
VQNAIKNEREKLFTSLLRFFVMMDSVWHVDEAFPRSNSLITVNLIIFLSRSLSLCFFRHQVKILCNRTYVKNEKVLSGFLFFSQRYAHHSLFYKTIAHKKYLRD